MRRSNLEDGLLDAEQPKPLSIEPLDADDEADERESEGFTDRDWKHLFKTSLSAAQTYQDAKLRGTWGKNYRAFNNRHMRGSKYETGRYKTRSKMFKPKTRMAVRKNDATAAGAMFSTEDVVSITPERAKDPVHAVTAQFIHEILNYRLDRANPKAGPSWFMTAIGARQDTQLTGICVSKQYWEYEEKTTPRFVKKPVLNEFGEEVIDPVAGVPVTERTIERQVTVVKDRPMCDLLPPEHALIDPTGKWTDPIQEGGYFIACFPMRREDVEEMLMKDAERSVVGGGRFRKIDPSLLDASGKSDSSSRRQGIRHAREDGTDRYESRHAESENGDILWLYECFYRIDGEDWHWWMLGESIMLSDPVPVEESYPEQHGMRPYVRGVGTLESHRAHPTAPVELWQPMQQEINDITNLRLDALKMSISPITKVRRGQQVDLRAVQNRGPDATILLNDMEDVMFDRAPTPPGDTQLDINTMSTDFDELAGVFSGSSVMANRQLNETVGGMRMLNGSANALTEFDLRVWVETWCEPVLRQMANLIRFYESDERIMAIAGEKAGLLTAVEEEAEARQKEREERKKIAEQMKKAGIEPPAELMEEGEDEDEQGLDRASTLNKFARIGLSQAIDTLAEADVHVRVNVGIGSVSSDQKLAKLMGATKITMETQAIWGESGIEMNGAALLQEIWGLSGYRDADRFFRVKKDTEKAPPPEVQLEMLKQKGRMQEKQADLMGKIKLEQLKQAAAQRKGQMEAMQKAKEAEEDYRLELEANERAWIELEHKLQMDYAGRVQESARFQHERQTGERDREDAQKNRFEDRQDRAMDRQAGKDSAKAGKPSAANSGGTLPSTATKDIAAMMQAIASLRQEVNQLRQMQGA